ncbi:MAG: ABC transporter permease [Acidobacteria bacterium]|nr:ABC transporter permease [Acidobacteriota bacterium]
MPLLSRLSSLWRNLFHRARRERELTAEIDAYLEMLTEEKIKEGLNPEEARRAALLELGGKEQVKEKVRDVSVGHHLETLWRDLLYALRMQRRSPGFTLIVVGTLALGIGANTAIFTLINTVMLKSLPVSHPEELVVLTRNNQPNFSQALWEQVRDHQDGFAGMFAYGSTGVDLSAGGEVRPASVGLVSGEFFSTLGVRPAAGRLLIHADDQRGCSSVAVITHAFWQSEFGGSENAIGKSIDLNGQPFQIVGVTEPAFFGVEFGYYVPIWAPQCAGTIIRGYIGSGMVIGRLKPGVSIEHSRARLVTLAPAILEATLPPNGTAEAMAQYRRSTFGVMPFSKGIQFLNMTYGEALLVLMAIVGVVLLIACANVANLLLARATARQHEIGVRLALGASRSRLIRQLLTESILLALLGAALGVLFAGWGSRILVGFLSRRNQVMPLNLAPDVNVLAFTVGVGVLTGVLFGLVPAWRAVRVDPHAVMRPHGRGVAQGHSRFSFGKVLVVSQIALSLVMIAGAGLLIGSWRRLATLDPGFRSAGVILAGVNTRPARIPADQRSETYKRILERLRALPGVGSASASTLTPFGNTSVRLVIDVEGFNPTSNNDASVRLNIVSAGYFATIGTPLLAGRDFNSGDVPTSPFIAIVNEELARKFFGNAGALGRHFRVRVGTGLSPPVEIVGVAASTKENSLRQPSPPIVYYALGQYTQPDPVINFALRTEGSPAALIPSVKAALAEIGPRFSLDIRTLQQQIDEAVRLPRTLGMLSGFFGALALLLAAIGLYGIISYSVARRRNEIGVRIALGATQARVIRMVLWEVGRLVVAGAALGILLALAVTRLVSTFLFGVEPDDPATLAISAFTLAAVALGAALIPAGRAARLHPMVALREE